MVDIHCHIISGLDDGAQDIETSMNMVDIAVKDGIRHIIATPHYIYGGLDNTSEVIKSQVDKLNDIIRHNNINLTVYEGCEAFICPELPQLVRDGTVSTLNNSMYILIELPMSNIPQYTKDVIYELKLYGYNPIIAHPERNKEIINDPTKLIDLVNRGALTQLNASSLTSLYGTTVCNTAIKLLKNNLIHTMASDAHSAKGRKPQLSKAKVIINKILNEETILNILDNNRRVLDNKPITPGEIHKIKRIRNNIFLKGYHKIVSSFIS